MRWQAGITPAMRVYYEDHRTGADRFFDIESVINIDELNEELVLMCKEELT
jgi:head-tail adaptor